MATGLAAQDVKVIGGAGGGIGQPGGDGNVNGNNAGTNYIGKGGTPATGGGAGEYAG